MFLQIFHIITKRYNLILKRLFSFLQLQFFFIYYSRKYRIKLISNIDYLLLSKINVIFILMITNMKCQSPYIRQIIVRKVWETSNKDFILSTVINSSTARTIIFIPYIFFKCSLKWYSVESWGLLNLITTCNVEFCNYIFIEVKELKYPNLLLFKW